MRLDFNILWVEDQPKAVQAQRVSIDRQVRLEGFRLEVQFAKSLTEAESFLSSDIFGDHIDLVLMDYDLGVGRKGDEGLGVVRKQFPFKDIIFYSSAAADLPEKVANARVQGTTAHVQGIYYSPRSDLPDTVVGVFESLVKKVLDIDHARGIVMGTTSDIDHHISDSLVAVFEKSDPDKRAATIVALKKHLDQKRKSFQKEADQIDAIKHVSELMDKHNVYTSNDRLRLLKNALEINALLGRVDGIKNYLSKIVPKRNKLAHIHVRHAGFSRKLIDKDGKEFTNEDMKELRVALLEHQELFEALSKELSS